VYNKEVNCAGVGEIITNTKIMFDSYPTPTIDQAFEQFGGATIFSVLD
jgi:hypothetical protein